MYTKIKQLADEALALQNKDRMDAALRQISAICATCADVEPKKAYAPGLAAMDLTEANLEAIVAEVTGERLSINPTHATYGVTKSYDSEAEMIADIQGAESPAFPIAPHPESVAAKATKKGAAK